MKEAKCYPLIPKRTPIFTAYLIFIAAAFTTLSVAIPDGAQQEARVNALLVCLCTAAGLIGGTLIYRAHYRRSHLVLNDDCVELVRGERKVWTLPWEDIQTAVLRRYILRKSSSSEDLTFVTAEGERFSLPTWIFLFSQMPDKDEVLAIVEGRGIPLNGESGPRGLRVH